MAELEERDEVAVVCELRRAGFAHGELDGRAAREVEGAWGLRGR